MMWGRSFGKRTINADGNFIFKAQAYRVSYSGFQNLPFNTLLKGDVNLDGEVTFLDISPFIGILSAVRFSG